MTDTAVSAAAEVQKPPSRNEMLREAMFIRRIPHYPNPSRRYFLLGMVIFTTVILYYLYFEEGAVVTLMLPYYGMTFSYFLLMLVVSNGVGAFSAFIGGLSDKIGRANLTVAGLLALGTLQLIVPDLHTKLEFASVYTAIGFIEGIVLVVTPALIRDYSPQMHRGTAMGFWAFGPTGGALVASVVASHTLTHLTAWQDQFTISGLVCLASFVLAFVFLRELAPSLRAQIMVSIRDRALIEARARGIDIEKALEHPLRTMLKLDLIVYSLSVSLFLIVFYTSVAVMVLYWQVVFEQTANNANGIDVWYCSFDCVTLIGAGVLSDYFHVRKPFMAIGGLGSIIVMIIFSSRAHHPTTGYYTLVLIMSFLGLFIAMAYAAWMASYTEAVEARNPALSATGLAVWAWILRLVVAASFVIMPIVITTATPIVDRNSAAVELLAFKTAEPYVPSITSATPAPSAPAAVLIQLRATNDPPALALADILQTYASDGKSLSGALGAVPATLKSQVAGLLGFQPLATDLQDGHTITRAQIASVGAAGSPQLAALLVQAQSVVPNQLEAPDQWQHWWEICIAGEVIFLGVVFLMPGRWSPRKAREDLEERDRVVAEELAKLQPAPL